MKVEKTSEFYFYEFSFTEWLVQNAVIELLDSQRRANIRKDEIPFNSATRVVFSDKTPPGLDSEAPVRWVVETDDAPRSRHTATPAQDLTILQNISHYAEEELTTHPDNPLLIRPIGSLVLNLPVDKPACSEITTIDQSIIDIRQAVETLPEVLIGWQRIIER